MGGGAEWADRDGSHLRVGPGWLQGTSGKGGEERNYFILVNVSH